MLASAWFKNYIYFRIAPPGTKSSGTLAPAGWTNAEATPVLVNGECKVGLPANSPTLFYRLTQP